MIEKLIDSLISSADIAFLVKAMLRLFFSFVFGAFIGNEREHINRPAGIRTHVLVCIGAALMMITSDYVCMRYDGIDPTRLGAQVISGIGFLGAGTIIKEGFSVKGLTTAASLWAVSCVGITCGAGFYSAAAVASVIIYFTLRSGKKIILRHTETKYICLTSNNVNEAARTAEGLFSKLSITIISSGIEVGEDGHIELKYVVAVGKTSELFDYAINKLRMEDCITGIHID